MESERGFEQARFSYDEGRGAEADCGSSQEGYEKLQMCGFSHLFDGAFLYEG